MGLKLDKWDAHPFICDFIYNYTLMWCSQLLSACGDLTICNAGYHLRFRQLEEGRAVDHRSSDGHGVLSAKKGQLRVWVVQDIHHFHSFGRAISIWIHLQLTGSAYSVLVNSSATSCVIHTLSIRMYMNSTGYVWWDYHGINQPWYRISSIRIM